MTNFLIFLFILNIVILFHEIGHFIFAKKSNMLVSELSLGFGPKIFSVKKNETEYSWRLFPLGGYNKIAGMGETSVPNRNFQDKTFIEKLAVLAAGAAFNLLSAILILSVVYSLTGVEKPIDEPIIGQVLSDHPAFTAGIHPGDKIIAINNHEIKNWNDVTQTIAENGAAPLTISVEKKETQLVEQLLITPTLDQKQNSYIIGIRQASQKTNVSLGNAILIGSVKTYDIIKFIFDTLTQKDVINNLAGPVGITHAVGLAAEQGFLTLVYFFVLISINIGVVNLLPIPGLDGWHMFIQFVEKIRGKAFNPNYLKYANAAGFSFLIGLFVAITINDIIKLI